MTLADIIIIIIIAVAVFAAAFKMYRDAKNKKGCCGTCTNCNYSAEKHSDCDCKIRKNHEIVSDFDKIPLDK